MLPFFSRPYPPVVVDCPAGSMVMSNDPSDEKILPPAPALCLGTRQSTMCPWCWEHLCSEAAHSPSQTMYPIPSCSNGVGYPSLILFSAFFFFFFPLYKKTPLVPSVLLWVCLMGLWPSIGQTPRIVLLASLHFIVQRQPHSDQSLPGTPVLSG